MENRGNYNYSDAMNWAIERERENVIGEKGK